MPVKFERPGITFLYPDNWTVEEEEIPAGRGSVTVYSPGGAFWSVIVHPRSVSPRRLAEAAVEAMKEEYEELEAEKTRETIAGHATIGYDLSFYCLDLINTACIRALRTVDGTYTVFCQAEDRDFERLEQVFQAMTTSLLDHVDRLRVRDGGEG
jgi:hypothetical protein